MPTTPYRCPTVGRLDMFSPEFQSLVTDKGGNDLAHAALGHWRPEASTRRCGLRHASTRGSPHRWTTSVKSPNRTSGDQLTWFFSQWLDSTGAPEFKTNTPSIASETTKASASSARSAQDLDLFRMPVDLKHRHRRKNREQTDRSRRHQLAFTVETFGKPRRISVDPDDHVLKNSTDVQATRFNPARPSHGRSRETSPVL